MTAGPDSTATVMTSASLLEHVHGHRRLTRRLIDNEIYLRALGIEPPPFYER